MIKKVFIVTTLAATLLSACGGRAPVETAVPTATEAQVATVTEAPAATEAPATSVTDVTPEVPATLPAATSAPEASVPTNAPDCTNSASFVTDVTIPDNSNVAPGATFTKIWRVKNTGTCIWGSGYTLTHYSDETMGAPAAVPLGVTLPGQTLDISVDLTASSGKGTHRGNFVIKNPKGLIMKVDEDSRLWVIINVSSTVASNATATPPGGASTGGTGTGSGGAGSGTGFANVTCAFTTDPAKVTEAINALNTYRAQNNLPAYAVNVQLTQAAQAHANDMACNQLFFHNGSNGSTPQSRVVASGYVASAVTENVYGSYPPLTGAGAVDWWKNDKTDIRHNQNLLSNSYTEIGLGYSFFNNFGYYVLVFAKP